MKKKSYTAIVKDKNGAIHEGVTSHDKESAISETKKLLGEGEMIIQVDEFDAPEEPEAPKIQTRENQEKIKN